MRRLIWIAASAFLLVGAGVAVARVTAAKSISAVSATFTATTASNVHTESCTGADGTYQATHGRWTGTASSSTGALNGPVTIDADALVNTTTGYGTVSGHLRIDGSDGSHTEAQFSATDTNGSIAGLAQGHGHPPGNGLLANLSASWSSSGGFTNGKLGGGTAGGDAVIVSKGACKPTPPHPTPPPKPERVEVHGTITSVSSTSITVAGVTCTVPTSLQAAVSQLKAGDRVELTCTVSGGVDTLQRIGGPKGHH